MSLLGYFLIALVIAVAVIQFLASRGSDVFRVERSAVIPAPPQLVFEQINSLAKWQGWSPWARKDPNARNTLSGPEAGTGSALAWEGNKQVGKGRMEISESVSPSRVVMKLEFFAPMKNTCQATFVLTPRHGGTEVHWAMEGPNLFMGKVMGLFMDMDKMVGRDFEQGLENLKAVVAR